MALKEWKAGDIVRVNPHLCIPGTMRSDPWNNWPVRIAAVFHDGTCEIRPMRPRIDYTTGKPLEVRTIDARYLDPIGVLRLKWERRNVGGDWRATFGPSGEIVLSARRTPSANLRSERGNVRRFYWPGRHKLPGETGPTFDPLRDRHGIPPRERKKHTRRKGNLITRTHWDSWEHLNLTSQGKHARKGYKPRDPNQVQGPSPFAGYAYLSTVFGYDFYGPTLLSVQLKAEAHLRAMLRGMIDAATLRPAESQAVYVVRLEALVLRMAALLENYGDCGPDGEGWQSVELQADLAEAARIKARK